MISEYTVNNVFDEEAMTLNDLICKIFTSFLDEELDIFSFSDIINTDITSSL